MIFFVHTKVEKLSTGEFVDRAQRAFRRCKDMLNALGTIQRDAIQKLGCMYVQISLRLTAHI